MKFKRPPKWLVITASAAAFAYCGASLYMARTKSDENGNLVTHSKPFGAKHMQICGLNGDVGNSSHYTSPNGATFVYSRSPEGKPQLNGVDDDSSSFLVAANDRNCGLRTFLAKFIP